MWKTKVATYSKISFNIFKWLAEVALLTFFWLVVLPSCFESDLFMDIEMSDVIRELVMLCVKPSVYDMTRRVITLLVLNLIFNFFIRYKKLTPKCYNITSAVIGYFVLHTNSYPKHLGLIFTFMVLGYLLILRLQYIMKKHEDMIRPVYTVSFISVIVTILGEFYFPDHQSWEESRGVIMIMTMKLITMAAEDYHLVDITYYEYFGYMLCPATVLFGPWLKLDEYRQHNSVRSDLNWKWPIKMIQILTYAMINMVLSNCLHRMLLVPGKSPWHVAFRNAWVFRTSNYFICYMAELTMITAGFNVMGGNDSGNWKYPCCHPLKVEFPRSMASVVRNWNIPVHRFLKTSVYLPFLDVGKLYAVFFTFFFSAMLHGLNIRITIILLSLGVLSFSQEVVQDALARKFNCCVKIKPCRDCEHRFGFFHPITIAINSLNLVCNMFHLAYLGSIMDESFAESTFLDIYVKWDDEFGLFTHHLIALWFAICLFLL